MRALPVITLAIALPVAVLVWAYTWPAPVGIDGAAALAVILCALVRAILREGRDHG